MTIFKGDSPGTVVTTETLAVLRDSNQWPATEDAVRELYIIDNAKEKRFTEKPKVQSLRDVASELDCGEQLPGTEDPRDFVLNPYWWSPWINVEFVQT